MDSKLKALLLIPVIILTTGIIADCISTVLVFATHTSVWETHFLGYPNGLIFNILTYPALILFIGWLISKVKNELANVFAAAVLSGFTLTFALGFFQAAAHNWELMA